MGVKIFSLYLISVASPLLTVNELAPSLNVAFSNWSTKSAIISQQQVNRSLKGDRLPIRQAIPETDMRVFDRKIDSNCKPPIDVPGRCFA